MEVLLNVASGKDAVSYRRSLEFSAHQQPGYLTLELPNDGKLTLSARECMIVFHAMGDKARILPSVGPTEWIEIVLRPILYEDGTDGPLHWVVVHLRLAQGEHVAKPRRIGNFDSKQDAIDAAMKEAGMASQTGRILPVISSGDSLY